MSTHTLLFVPWEQVVAGITIGSRLFLVAIGLSLIFGVLDVLNFAHGVLYMIGAYVAVLAVESATGNFWLGVVGAVIVVAIVGGLLEGIFIRRLYGREEEELDQLLLTFAFVLIITDVTRTVFGSGSKLIEPPALFRTNLDLGFVAIPSYRAFVIVMSVVVLAGLLAVLRYTNIGRIVRATSSDREMAQLLGINVPLLYTGVFIAGSALAGIGGALAAPLHAVTPSLGDQVIVNAFVVVVIGGLGSFVGAFVGAMIIGLLIALGSGVAGAGVLFPFLAMIVVLVFKPTGLFGGVEA